MAVQFVITPSVSLRNLHAVSRADSLLSINILKQCCCNFHVLVNNQEAFQKLGFIIAKGGRKERRRRERGRWGIESQGSLNQLSSTPPQLIGEVPRTALVPVSQEGLWAKITINHDHTRTEPSFQHLEARCLHCHHRMVPRWNHTYVVPSDVYCNTCFIVVWNQTHNISEVCLYSLTSIRIFKGVISRANKKYELIQYSMY